MNEIINKRTERNKTFDLGNGKKRLVCHGKPIHYINSKRNWEDIVLDFQDDGKGNFIADKNKVSVGFRKDLQLYKYFGARYDSEHQFESTIIAIKLDKVEQVKSDKVSSLTKKSKTEIAHRLNSKIEIINRINEVSLKNFVKVSDPIEDFKLVEELHLKGLTCSNQKKGNQYIVDKFGRFNFVDEKGELKFWINQPFFIDNEGETSKNIVHTLQETKGHLIYTKTPTEEGKDDLVLAQYPILIDTNTYYSSTADGALLLSASAWNTVYTGTTADSVINSATYANITQGVYDGKNYLISRSFFDFDTSDLPVGATVTVATLKLYAFTAAGSVVAQMGTQASSLTTADYNNFSGLEYGHATFSLDTYNSINFNTQGKADVNKTGITKICCREYTHDYLNSTPTDTTGTTRAYFSEDTTGGGGTDRDPKLEIDYTEGGGDDYRRRIIISGFMKLKTILIVASLLASFFLGFGISKISQQKDYYIWHKNEKVYISEQLKEYIENIEQGNVDRLKSKRGVKINN